MVKKIVRLFMVVAVFMLLGTHTFVFSKTSVEVVGQKVVYPLPYPGILADHPLYPLKLIRDTIIVFTTRDNIKKAQLYLHLSDKHMSIAIALAEKGKENDAVQELIRGEEYFSEIPPLLNESKKQGTKPTNDFISKLSQGNLKHKEVITDVMKNLNEAKIETINSVLEMNAKSAREIKSL
jgi:hypothetical protein